MENQFYVVHTVSECGKVKIYQNREELSYGEILYLCMCCRWIKNDPNGQRRWNMGKRKCGTDRCNRRSSIWKICYTYKIIKLIVKQIESIFFIIINGWI